MDRKDELAVIAEELLRCAASLTSAAETITAMLGKADPDSPAEPQPKFEEVRAVLAGMSRKGYTDQIRALLQKYGADKLSAVDPGQYRALLHDAEEMIHAT